MFEARKASRSYQEGCIQFSRDLFPDYDNGLGGIDYEHELDLIFNGTYTGNQVYSALVNTILCVQSPDMFRLKLAPYLQLLAQSAGAINTDGPLVREQWLISPAPLEWTYAEDRWEIDQQYFEIEVIERNLAKELARDVPHEEHIVQLRILQARYNHGWIRRTS